MEQLANLVRRHLLAVAQHHGHAHSLGKGADHVFQPIHQAVAQGQFRFLGASVLLFHPFFRKTFRLPGLAAKGVGRTVHGHSAQPKAHVVFTRQPLTRAEQLQKHILRHLFRRPAIPDHP